MKVIFLDIDGVLVTLGSLKRGRGGLHGKADDDCVAALNKIIESTNAVIVVSSTWRLGGVMKIRAILKAWGVRAKIIGVTPNLTRPMGAVWVSSTRGDEIRLWLAGHPEVQQFVILDDDADMGELSNALVQTQFETGLTSRHAERAVKLLAGR